MDTLFGEGQFGLKVVLFVIVALGLLALAFWLLRRFGGGRLGGGGATRGRQSRLAVIDQATIDSRRCLVLIRRDNVEHLLIIGGPSDVVVEQNIVRAATAAIPARPPAADTLPREIPLGEDGMWPLQPEPSPKPGPQPRVDPPPRPEPRPWPPKNRCFGRGKSGRQSRQHRPLPRASANRAPATRWLNWRRSCRARLPFPNRPSSGAPRDCNRRRRRPAAPRTSSRPPIRTSRKWRSDSRLRSEERR